MTSLSPLSLDDYDAIASAVMETERGRWFMAEFARRNRAADTAAVLTALAELERAMAEKRSERPAPTAEAQKIAALVRRIGERAALVRNELNTFTQGVRIQRAHRQLDHMERLVGLALAAAGLEQEDVRKALPAPPTTARDDDAAATAAWQAESEAPSTSAVQSSAIATPDGSNGASSPAIAALLGSEVVVNGHAIDIFAAGDDGGAVDDVVDGDVSDDVDEDAAPGWSVAPVFRKPARADDDGEDAPAPERQTAASGERPRMPAAWTPSLLESLSDEEKAILFA